MKTANLKRGTLVISNIHLNACNTPAGTLGVVFEETDAYGDGGGPMVRFVNDHACNVYEGDVSVVEQVPAVGARDVV